MNKLFKFIENISLAVLANSIYSLAHGDTSKINAYILFGTLYIMLVTILLQED